MNKVVYLLLLVVCFSHAQEVPLERTLTPSKMKVRSDEKFTVTYQLVNWMVDGYYYVAIDDDDYFDVFGITRWEGQINLGEKKVITFTLKLKKDRLRSSSIFPIVVKTDLQSFGKYLTHGLGAGCTVEILDYEDLIREENEQSAKAVLPRDSVRYRYIDSVLATGDTVRFSLDTLGWVRHPTRRFQMQLRMNPNTVTYDLVVPQSADSQSVDRKR